MTAKRTLHIDLQGTLIVRHGFNYVATHNGPMIVSFARAALNHGHDVATVTWSLDRHDQDLETAYPEDYAMLSGAIDKGVLDDAVDDAINAGDYDAKTHDILIDDDPMVEPGEVGFENFANIVIDPNSPTLAQDLEALAREEFGFKWSWQP